MFIKALIAFLVLPGIVGGLIPIALGITDPWRGGGYGAGIPIIGMGAIILGWCVRDFYVSGKGTLAPWAPPKNLVIVGLYRHTRNPMYIGVLFIIGGISALFGSPLVAGYLVLSALGFHIWVILPEEPRLTGRFDRDYIQYKEKVPRWLPRLKPYQEETDAPSDGPSL